MLSGVGIICFAGSYAVALALEISRLLFRSGVRGAVMLGFAGAGLLAHSAFLYYQAVKTTGSALSSERDWYLLAAWVLVVVYLYLVYYHPRTAFGLFLLPLVLGLVGAGAFADRTPFDQDRAARIWGIIHGTSFLLATVSMLIGFAAGLMYLGQARRLKHRLPPIRGLRLPSLEWLQRANGRVIVVSVLTLGVGVLSGIILNRVRAARLSWGDPVVFTTTVMFAWLAIAVVLGALYRPAREGRKVACLTLVSFVFLLIALAMFLERQHGRGSEGGRGKGEGGTARWCMGGLRFRVRGSGFRVQGRGVRGHWPGIRGGDFSRHYLPSGQDGGATGQGLAGISHQHPTLDRRVPLLRRSSAGRNPSSLLALRQAVAHYGEKCGLEARGRGSGFRVQGSGFSSPVWASTTVRQHHHDAADTSASGPSPLASLFSPLPLSPLPLAQWPLAHREVVATEVATPDPWPLAPDPWPPAPGPTEGPA